MTVQNSITDMVKDVANEPSVGLYFVQQHVHKAVPGLLSLKVGVPHFSSYVFYLWTGSLRQLGVEELNKL